MACGLYIYICNRIHSYAETNEHTHTHIYIYIYMCVCVCVCVYVCLCSFVYIYIYVYIYVVPSMSFQTFFVQVFKIVADSWKFSMLLLYTILWDDWPIFIISGSNDLLHPELEYTQLKPDCHSWWISKLQSGREDTLEERYAIKFSCKLGKMPQKRMECFRMLVDHLTWNERQFLSGIRDSRKAGSLWGMIRGVGGERKSIHHSWLAKGFRVTMLRI